MRAIFPSGVMAVLAGLTMATLATALMATLMVALTACGQQGPLFLPTESAAANRATLTQTLRPGTAIANPPAPSASSPSAPQ